MYKDLRDIYANYTSLTVEEIQENLHHDSIESSLSYKKVNIEKEKKKEEKDIFKDIKLNTREQKELYNKAKEFYLKYNRLPTNGELRDIEFDGKKRGDYRRSKAVIEAMEACLK
jgi:hypothetical protein